MITKVTRIKKSVNEKPEKVVEKAVMAYASEMGWYLNVVDSKAVFNPRAGRYIAGMAKKGFPDLVGCDTHGNFLAIELKSPGRLSTAKVEQVAFLNEVNERGGFGFVTDSVDRLHEAYLKYLSFKLSA